MEILCDAFVSVPGIQYELPPLKDLSHPQLIKSSIKFTGNPQLIKSSIKFTGNPQLIKSSINIQIMKVKIILFGQLN